MEKKTYVLTLPSGNHPHSWELPQNKVMANKPGAGKKFIAYFRGEDTIYVEDMYQKNKDIRPSRVPAFEYNEIEKRTQLQVDVEDKNLVMYLEAHPWFNKKYKATSRKIEAEQKLESFEKLETALDLVRDADPVKVKANALAVLGLNYFGKSLEECTADLKAKALKDPDTVIRVMQAADYQSRYIASLAYCNDIIKNNATHTAIVWSDNEGVIVHVAKGESGIDKLTEFLNTGSADAETILQAFNERLDKVAALKKEEAFDSATAKKELSAKDKEIEELKKQLAAKNAAPATEEDNSTKVELTLEEATTAYKEKFGDDVPTAKVSNLKWITAQLEK